MAKSFFDNPFRGLAVRLALRVSCALVFFAVPAFARNAALDPEPAYRDVLDARLMAAEITAEQHLLLRFERIFAPQLLPEDLRAANPWPSKCATDLVSEYERKKGGLSPETVHLIDGWL